MSTQVKVVRVTVCYDTTLLKKMNHLFWSYSWEFFCANVKAFKTAEITCNFP